MKQVKLYNCICNDILASTSLLYPLRLHVTMTEKTHYEHEKRHKTSFLLHRVSVQQFVSNLVPKHKTTEGLGHLLFLHKAQESYRKN